VTQGLVFSAGSLVFSAGSLAFSAGSLIFPADSFLSIFFFHFLAFFKFLSSFSVPTAESIVFVAKNNDDGQDLRVHG
jgi:hypothetical protein